MSDDEPTRSKTRTPAPYPTYGPDGDGGKSWHDYFEDMRLERQRASREATEVIDAGKIEILEHATPCDPPAGTIDRLVKRLAACGYEVGITRSKALMPAVRYLTAGDDHARGAIRTPEHELEHYTLIATKRAGGGVVAIEAGWERKEGKPSMAFTGAHTFDPWNGREWRPRVASSRPQTTLEIESAAPAPLGLTPWLDLVAPKAVPKKRKKETA